MGSSDPAAASLLGDKARAWMGGVLVILGVQCWLVLGQGDYGHRAQRWLLVLALLTACIPWVHRPFIALLDRYRNPSPRGRLATAILIALAAAIYLPFTAWNQGREFFPIWQDSQSYAIQIQMLAHGRLWMPPHPLPDFFDTFQMIVTPVYASMYFPGASFFYVPGVWIGLPYWVISSLLAGASVGLIYWVGSDVLDHIAGILAALMLVGLKEFRHTSIMLLGHPAILVLVLLMIAIWLAWRKCPSWPLAAALGFVSGWAAITRPLDALIIALPIGIDMVVQLRRRPLRQWFQTGGALVGAASPFLILQIIFNIAVTGTWSRTPFDLHADLYYPGTSIGFHALDPSLRPKSVLPQKQQFHDEWTIPAIQRHQPDRILRNWLNDDLNNLARFTLPHVWLTVLIPAALLGLTCRKRVLLAVPILLWILCFTFYTFFLPHYLLVIAPAMIVFVLLGAQQFEFTWPRLRPAIATFLTFAVLIVSLTQLHEFNRVSRDQMLAAGELTKINQRLSAPDVRTPAVVLFRVPEKTSPAVEPVYNMEVVWPDDARIIRAHDLGDRNIEIFTYYARLQPDRAFYRYDRARGELTYLGLARELGHAD